MKIRFQDAAAACNVQRKQLCTLAFFSNTFTEFQFFFFCAVAQGKAAKYSLTRLKG